MRGITGFSNCNDKTISDEPSYVTIAGVKDPIYAGMKWQVRSSRCDSYYIRHSQFSLSAVRRVRTTLAHFA